ncbi:hypothetical protein OSB04_un001461 [Centaurea solstitialis]|uniref:Uncharacterized protein n=1 Tax=Centaurea solstitialis TaxID=347529 RepID=A0AA38SFW1_9ASTR|nr:hypothetical protein OSB04_un001461 [Centaurea solstitialis]
MISHTGTETRPRLLREAAWGIFRNGRKLTEQCRVEVEGPRVMNFFSRRRSNDAVEHVVYSMQSEETLPGLDMPRNPLEREGAFGNADTGGAWLSLLVPHTAVNRSGPCTHRPSHYGSGHARSRYLNRKEGDAEGRLVTGVKS